ncbi:MAG TPA: gluconokinase [Methylomirabilota bacterium]|nr:gluconokinase [Methylomirabilota bacterium]
MILALDVGTSSARAAMYDETATVPRRFHQSAYEPTLTADGGVEHDPNALLAAVAACLDAVLAGPGLPDVAGVGVATFWHGLLGFDGAGHAVTPVYMWADTRGARDATLLAGALDEAALHARTGCHVHASYWPAKLRWLARARPAEAQRVMRWGSIGEHLELAFFGEGATSVSMASATGLFDQAALTWDATALAAAGIGSRQLFPLVDRTEPRRGLRPAWARRWPALRGVPWFPAIGDGAAGNVGSECVDPSRIALNVGTSAALRAITTAPGSPPRGLWRYRVDRRLAIVGGALSEGGNLLAWCRDVLRLPEGPATEAALAALPADGHGLTVLPFIAGERAPGWRGERRASITGLRLDTTGVHILRAVLEAIALRLGIVHELLRPCVAPDHAVLASGGGVAHSRTWAQIIADVLGRAITVLPDEEATSRGAALLALSALGLRPELASARPPVGETVRPDAARHAHYRDALARQRALDARLV